MAGKLTESVYLQTQREKKLMAERIAWQRCHKKPWYLTNKKNNEHQKSN